MSELSAPLRYLNPTERRLLGWVVARLYDPHSTRLQRAIERSGERATVRMACVNALRLYAVASMLAGMALQVARLQSVSLVFYGLAGASMAWSFWCLATTVGPEREHKRMQAVGR